MFVDFFFHLRRHGLKVGVQEWLDLVRALSLGLAEGSLAKFYFLCRSLTVKDERQLDLFDRCFAEWFAGVAEPPETTEQVLDWLKDAVLPRELSPEVMARLKELDLAELTRLFAERLAEQKERHDGGNRWIGTGGTSAFGHGGFHPSGLRIGGPGGMRGAMQVAMERRFRNLRGDVVLDTRQLAVALKRLRLLVRDGARDELDLAESIAQTARNAGDIELAFRAPRQNTVRLLLLLDVGGSMTAHARLSEQLFSAAKALNHFREFKAYYFHNCVYDDLYTDMQRLETKPTLDVLAGVDENWYLLIVGDAAMSPYELTAAGGAIDYTQQNAEPGVAWLTRLRRQLPRSVWLNPEPEPYWQMPSTRIVRQVFPDMFPLTVDGLERAVARLRRPTL